MNYTFSDPTQITVAERDSALQKFKTEFQNYVDNLSEADLASSNIKTVLSEKADELENSLSTAKMKLSCEVENVEVHNAGEEIVNNWKPAARRQKKKSRRRADNLTRSFETAALIFRAAVSLRVRLAAHVSNGLKSRIHPVVGRI